MSKKAYIGVDGKARKVKKGYVGVENFVPRALPSGYTQLSYIESTGAQYFDTGFKANNNTRVVLSAYNASTSSGWTYGAWDSSSSNQFAFSCLNTYSFRYGSGGVQLTTLPVGDFEVDQNKNAYNLNGTSGTITAQAFSCSHTMYLFAINANGAVSSGKFIGRIKKCQIYDNGTLVRDYVPCKNASGVVGLYDMVNGTFGGSATTTAFVAGEDTYKSIARKIKKAYIGIGGVARPCWSGGELAYYGKITALSVARSELAATTIGNYALFGGGGTNSSYYNNVDAYTASLVRSNPNPMAQARKSLGATSVGKYAVFAGGFPKGSTNTNKVDAYNESLSVSNPDGLSVGRYGLAATKIGSYAVFAGGGTTSGYSNADAYNESLTRTTLTSLAEAKTQLAATTVGDYAIFAGGTTKPDAGHKKSSVDTYNKSLTKGTATALQEAKSLLAAATVGNYAIFAGGTTGTTFAGRTVDAYDSSLTRTKATNGNKYGRQGLAATTVGDFAIFAGGVDQDAVTNIVEVYDASLTKTVATSLGTARFRLAATTIGNYAVFGGGRSSNANQYSNAEAFVVA